MISVRLALFNERMYQLSNNVKGNVGESWNNNCRKGNLSQDLLPHVVFDWCHSGLASYEYWILLIGFSQVVTSHEPDMRGQCPQFPSWKMQTWRHKTCFWMISIQQVKKTKTKTKKKYIYIYHCSVHTLQRNFVVLLCWLDWLHFGHVWCQKK